MTPRARVAVLALGLDQCVAWGVLYYAFGVVLVPMSRDLGASAAAVAAAMSIAALTTAVVAVPLGRRFERARLPAWMALGTVWASGVLVGWSRVGSLAGLYLVGVGLGLAQALTLYEPAFALVARWFVDERTRARALVTVTLFGGLASTVFVPLTTLLIERLGWRSALLWLAALLVVLPGALNGLLLPRLMGCAAPARTTATPDATTPAASVEPGPSLAGLAVLFFAVSLTTAALAVHLPTALTTFGYGAYQAAAAVGWTGAMQLAGRLGLPLLSRLRTISLSLLVSTAPLVVGFVTLSAAPPWPILLMALSVLGAGAGALTLMRPLAVGRRFPAEAFGRVSGVLALAHQAARAAGPLAAAWVYDLTGSYQLLFAGAAGVLVLATGLSVQSTRLR